MFLLQNETFAKRVTQILKQIVYLNLQLWSQL